MHALWDTLLPEKIGVTVKRLKELLKDEWREGSPEHWADRIQRANCDFDISEGENLSDKYVNHNDEFSKN
jgi:hypothetical protein